MFIRRPTQARGIEQEQVTDSVLTTTERADEASGDIGAVRGCGVITVDAATGNLIWWVLTGAAFLFSCLRMLYAKINTRQLAVLVVTYISTAIVLSKLVHIAAYEPARMVAWSRSALSSGGWSVFGLIFAIVVVRVGFATIGSIRSDARVLAAVDYLAETAVIAIAIGRVGCLFNGCCFGKVTEYLGVVYPPDRAAGLLFGPQALHAVQLYESFLLLVSVPLVRLCRQSTVFATGDLSMLSVMTYGVVRVLLQPLRGDSPAPGTWRDPTWHAAGIMVAAVVVLLGMRLFTSFRRPTPGRADATSVALALVASVCLATSCAPGLLPKPPGNEPPEAGDLVTRAAYSSDEEWAQESKRFLDGQIGKRLPELRVVSIDGGASTTVGRVAAGKTLILLIGSGCSFSRIDLEYYRSIDWHYRDAETAIVLMHRIGRQRAAQFVQQGGAVAKYFVVDAPLPGWLGRYDAQPISLFVDGASGILVDWSIHSERALKRAFPYRRERSGVPKSLPAEETGAD